MRSKAQILRETLTTRQGTQGTDAIIAACLPLTVEVLLDIRQTLDFILTVLIPDEEQDLDKH